MSNVVFATCWAWGRNISWAFKQPVRAQMSYLSTCCWHLTRENWRTFFHLHVHVSQSAAWNRSLQRHTRWIPVPVFEGEVVPGKDKTWLRVGTKLSSSDTRCQDGGTSVKWPWQLNMDQECKEPVKDKTWPCDGTKLFSRAAEQRVSLKRCQNGGTRVKWPWQLNMDQECKVPVKDRVFLCSDYC